MANRFCSNCGQKLSEDDNFCAFCGTKVPQNAPEKTPHPEPPPVPKSENFFVRGFKAFVEMWFFIVMTTKADSAEEKRVFRREAKKRMFKTPILALACPAATIALCVWSNIQVNKTGKTFFVYTTITFALISLFIVLFYLFICFTKLEDKDEATPLAMPVQPRAPNTSQNQKLPGWITWSINIVVWLAALALIGVMSIPAIRFISKKANEIASRSGGSSSSTFSLSSTSKSSRTEPLVVDTSNAVDINYQDHSSLSPGTICKISNYRVLTTMRDGVIAMFDYAQDYKTKNAVRAFVGDGLVNLAEMGENSSKPNIAILTERTLCDDDAIPTIFARYEGIADTALGRLRCFREVRPKR